jgi:hypothetical protein
MTSTRTALLALLSLAACGLAVGQTPPAQDQSSPSSASSPAQRDTTSTPATEAPADTTGDPAAASSPHQKQAAGKAGHEKMLKDCVTKERARDSSVSKDDAKKTCEAQMKMSSEKSKAY